jgi:hypothetical protein
MPTGKLESVAFTIEPGQVTRTSTGSRAVLKFEAPAKRHLDGGLDLDVYAILFNAQGRFVHRRSSERSRTVLANRAAWTHEIDNDVIANATRIVYEIAHRFDYRRKIVAGELPELPSQADGSDYFRWIDLDPRTLEDRCVKLDVGFWARNSNFEITMSQTPKLPTDSCRTEWELDLLDAQGSVAFARTGSISLNYGMPAFDDSSISMDRKAMRQLKFFELRGRTECRAIAPLALDAIPPG